MTTGTQPRLQPAVTGIVIATLFACSMIPPAVASTVTWLRVNPVSSPSARSAMAMTYDPVSKKVVLFGGFDANGYLNDTWKWVEKDFTLITVPKAGHFVHRDAPEFVTRRMLGWLLQDSSK